MREPETLGDQVPTKVGGGSKSILGRADFAPLVDERRVSTVRQLESASPIPLGREISHGEMI